MLRFQGFSNVRPARFEPVAFRGEANAPTFLFCCFPLLARHSQSILQKIVYETIY